MKKAAPLCPAAFVLIVAALGFSRDSGAQDGSQSGVPRGGARDMAALQHQQALAAIEADRFGYVSAIIAELTDVVDGGEELSSILMRASAEQLWAAKDARTRVDVLGAIGEPALIGDSDADLVFTPVTPCRLLDTRLAGGALSPGVTRTFGVNGTPGFPGDLSGQGGSASDCGIPVDPLAVAVTLTAVSPAGNGNIRAFAFGDPVPLASSLNYAPPTSALANTTIFPVCDGCGTGLDVDIQANVSAVHLVGDVVGYFESAGLTPNSQGNRTSAIDLTAACTNLTSCTITNSGSSARNVLVMATVNTRIDHAGGQDDVIDATIAAANNTCASPFNGATGSAWAHIDGAVPTGCCFENSISPIEKFSLPANTTATYFLNARTQILGGGTFQNVDSATIQCMLLR